MVSYALDIENQRIVSAMLELGIGKEELITKYGLYRKLEDFAGFNVTPEIQKLRYEHYTKLLKNTVNEIRDLLKKRHVTMLPGEYKATATASIEEATYESNKVISQEFNRFPPKQREILINTLTSFDLIKLPKKDKPKPLKPNKSEKDLNPVMSKKNYKEMFKKHQDLQIMNMNNLKSEQKKFQIDLYNKTAKSMKEHEMREKLHEDFKKILAKEREEMYMKKKESIDMRKLSSEQMTDNDIVQRLERFDKKIHKSEEIRIEAIKNKIQKTVKLREASERVEMRYKDKSKSNELELFNKLVDKQNKVKTARERNEEKIHDKMQKTKEEFEKRHNVALERIKSAENDLFYNAKKMENQMRASQKVVQDRKKKMSEDFQMKKELNKLKDYECLLKVQRAKRRFVKII